VKTAVLKETLVFVIDLVQQVGDMLCGGADRKKRIRYKGAVDLVTQYDKKSQHRIVHALKKRYPDFGILSEEAVRHRITEPVKWIVDPLDGTTNFAHGLPIWTISIALEIEGDIVLGVVYDPTRRELFSALAGRGAYLNAKKISVSRIRDLDRALLITGFPYDIRKSTDNNLDHFSDFAVRAQAVRRLGSAAMDLCYTACGRFDGYWEKKLSPWDQAAGSLILREAGGMITDFRGKPFDIYGDEVLGTNGLIHRQMMKILLKKIVKR
jgi:myo-inositol-1(or 4)-monophosphatase